MLDRTRKICICGCVKADHRRTTLGAVTVHAECFNHPDCEVFVLDQRVQRTDYATLTEARVAVQMRHGVN